VFTRLSDLFIPSLVVLWMLLVVTLDGRTWAGLAVGVAFPRAAH
jgi:hypothetical protein